MRVEKGKGGPDSQACAMWTLDDQQCKVSRSQGMNMPGDVIVSEKEERENEGPPVCMQAL